MRPYFLGVVVMKYIRLIKADEVDRNKGFKDGDIFEVDQCFGGGYIVRKHHVLHKHQCEILLANRQLLSDFLKLNNIKKTLVSQYLGYSQNWLTQMANDKRRDMMDTTLQEILKNLHIDWTQDTFIYVKATKEHTAYRTRPCTYEHDKHKERLQRAMWDGLFVKA